MKMLKIRNWMLTAMILYKWRGGMYGYKVVQRGGAVNATGSNPGMWSLKGRCMEKAERWKNPKRCDWIQTRPSFPFWLFYEQTLHLLFSSLYHLSPGHSSNWNPVTKVPNVKGGLAVLISNLTTTTICSTNINIHKEWVQYRFVRAVPHYFNVSS